MKRLFNVFEIVGWSYVLFDTLFNIYEDPDRIMNQQAGNIFGRALLVMRIVQTAQVLDFLLSSGNIFSVLAQYIGRMTVGWLFLNQKTSALSLACTLIPWALADIIRYTYYINKNDFICFLRYNSFMILYPVGVLAGEIPSIEQFLNHQHKGTEFYETTYYFGRAMQVLVFFGMIFLSMYLFKARSNHYKKINSEKHAKSHTPKSGNKKRD